MIARYDLTYGNGTQANCTRTPAHYGNVVALPEPEAEPEREDLGVLRPRLRGRGAQVPPRAPVFDRRKAIHTMYRRRRAPG